MRAIFVALLWFITGAICALVLAEAMARLNNRLCNSKGGHLYLDVDVGYVCVFPSDGAIPL